jgi:outer membrane protein OmpA-like peptidoglycan-associated protein
MKNFNYLILLLFIGNSFMSSAQNAKQRKADRLFNDLAYTEAVEVYKDLVERDHNTLYNKQRLGDSYIKLRRPEQAVAYYEEVVNQPNVSPEYYYKYAQALRGVKRYDDSREWLQKYRNSNGDIQNVDRMLDGEVSDIDITDEYSLDAVDFNSGFSDFGAFEKDGKVYFVSSRDEGMSKKSKTYSWTGEPFLDIYQIEAGNVSPLPGDVNTVLHDGPLTITKDGKYMYFNRNNYLNNKQGKRDKDKTNHLKIYRATNVNGQWKDVVELPFNNDSYSVGHPALSADEKTLYFASDMPGGQGGTDIYKVEILGENEYGLPSNLGREINTPQDEAFPFVTEYNVLYFSSNGHLGMGMMDIFKADLGQMVVKVENLGAPVNSNLDDFAYFKMDGNNTGYFSSNREGGIDNIYGFNLLNPLMLKGTVTDAINQRPVPNATVRLFDENNKQVAFLETDEDGNYETEISRNKEYPVEAKHIEYQEKTGTISSMDSDEKDELVYNIALDPIEDVEYLAEIDIIYFDFDRHNIRPDAAKELDKLVDLMQNKYPELVIEIGSHTDRRGSERYNEGLAERRAQATYDYLVSNGISSERIVEYRGYGKKEPAVDCDNCTERDHQMNRRSIFKVVQMK